MPGASDNSDVSVKISGDGSTLKAAFDQSSQLADAVGRKMEQAAARATAAWQRETLAQNRSADAAKEAARAKEMAALKADILSRSEQQLAEQALVAAAAEERAAAAALRLAGAQEAAGDAASHSSAKMAYASGAIRLFENGMGGSIRAAERFTTLIPGLSGLLEAAFPVVGAIALTGALIKVGEAAWNAYQNIVNMKGAIQSLNGLQINVDKVVARAADEIETQVEGVLERGQGKAAAMRQRASYQSSKPIDLSEYFYSDQFKKLPDDLKTNYETLYKSIAPSDLPDRLAKIRSEVGALNDAIARNKEVGGLGLSVKSVGGFGPDTTRNPDQYFAGRLLAAQQIQKQLEAQSDLRGATLQNTQGEVGDAERKEAEDHQRKLAEAARQAQAAQRKADADHIRALEEQFALQKSAAPMHSYETQTNFEQRQRLDQASFWGSHVKDFSPGSQESKRALEEQQRSLLEYNDTQQKGAAALQKMLANPGQLKDQLPELSNQRDLDARLRSQSELGDLMEQVALKQKEAAIAQEAQTGQLSRFDAAVQLATVHTRAFEVAMDLLEKRRSAIDKDTTLNSDQRTVQFNQVDLDQAKLKGDRGVQVIGDAQNISIHSGMGALSEDLKKFVTDSQDTAEQVTAIWDSSIEKINDQLSKALTGQRTQWKNMFSGVAGDISKTLMKRVEGSVLSALGVGGNSKPDGTQGNPMYVKNADGSIAGGGGLLDGMFGFGGGDSTSAGGASGGGASSVIGTIASMATMLGFANGGPVPGPNIPIMVGEAGPEVFMPSTSGSIIPNSALSGGSGRPIIQIDARHSGDPAMTNAIVSRGLYKAAPSIAAMGAHAQREQRFRTPNSRR